MYRFYEKVPQTSYNPYGMQLLDREENPFKTGPCLVSMLTLAKFEKHINGALNIAMEVLRLRTKRNPNANNKLEDLNGRILSIAYGSPIEDDNRKNGREMEQVFPTKTQTEEFVNTFLVPLVSENGRKISANQAMKNIRNVNFLTYCGATWIAIEMLADLNREMQKLNYNEQETDMILSQICVIGHATDAFYIKEQIRKEKTFGTHFSFVDVNDKEITVPTERRMAMALGDMEYENECFYSCGTGNHKAKSIFYEMSDLILGISSVATKVFENSIINKNSNRFIPLRSEDFLIPVLRVISEKKAGKSNKEIMQRIEKEIIYESNQTKKSTDDDGER